ncbi:MAG: hypothetical protein U0R71_17130 [Solirubrobacterales bacterium]
MRENREAFCGLYAGILAELDPKARLRRFEPCDPDRADCLVEVATA